MTQETTMPARRRQRYDGADVAQRIRLLVDIMREQADWNQTEFARKVGISKSRLSHYLGGTYHPQLDTVARIGEKLGVSLEWLVFGSGPMWEEDLHRQGIGVNECALAFSAVLGDIAQSIRRRVAETAEEEEAGNIESAELPMDEYVDRLLKSRLSPLLTANSRQSA